MVCSKTAPKNTSCVLSVDPPTPSVADPMPCPRQVLVTGAMDGEVRLHKAPFSSPDLTDCFSCHRKRVHAVEVRVRGGYAY